MSSSVLVEARTKRAPRRSSTGSIRTSDKPTPLESPGRAWDLRHAKPNANDPPAPGEVASSTLAALRVVDLSTRFNMRVLAAMTATFALLMQVSRFKTRLFWVTTLLLAATSLYALALEIRAARGRPVTPGMTSVAGALSAASALSAAAYLSPLSSMSVVPCVLVVSWALGGSSMAAWGVYLTCALGYLALAIAAAIGVLPLSETQLPPARADMSRALFGLTVVVELMLAVSFWLGRRTRAALESSIAQVGRAQEDALRRSALLDEAREELRNVIEGGKMGARSGTELGPYRLHELIGRGGMGEVYRVVHKGTGEPAAVKVLHAAALEDKNSVARFLREAEISSALASEHVVKVLESGSAPDGAPYLAMELLTGTDLGHHLQQHGRLTLAETVELTAQLAQALGVAEEAGIVHRDLKPSNVFRSAPGDRVRWTLLDFGVSKLRESGGTLTRGAAIGTPAYMSPEQVLGMPVDHRSDVFSLAAIAYRALTGQPAFSGPDHLAIMYKVHHQQPPRPSAFVAIPADVDLVLAIALAKDRAARFASAHELAEALAGAAEGRLSGALRDRAHALLAKRPWQATLASDATLEESR